MKTIQFIAFIGLAFITGSSFAQQKPEINLADSTGLPGDHFSLQGALAMFKESKSLEDFEKRLNEKDNAVNNLDLNADKQVDYVRVVADKQDDMHIIVLQVPVSKTEIQDVAVLQIEKNGENSAIVQILGDELLYGETIIVEPKEDGEPSDPGVIRKGPAGFTYHSPMFYFNVWHWPCVRFMYAPVYVVYISPWYWNYWPGWWSPWHPFAWRYHYMSSWHYHHHYHYAPYHRTTSAHHVYAPRRSRSNYVNNQYRDARNHYQDNRGTRPRPGAVMNEPRPKNDVQTQPAGRPNQSTGRPAQPQTKPTTRPEQAPRPQQQVKPEGRPQQQVKPEGRPQQQVKPEGRPQQQVRPEQAPPRSKAEPSVRPDEKPQVKPKSRPRDSRPKANPQSRPQAKPKSTPPRQQKERGRPQSNPR